MVSNFSFDPTEGLAKASQLCLETSQCMDWCLQQHLMHDMSIPLGMLVTSFIILMVGLMDKDRRGYYMWIMVPMLIASIYFCLKVHNIS